MDYCSADLEPFSGIASIDSPRPDNIYSNAAGIVFHTNIPIQSILNVRLPRLLGFTMESLPVMMILILPTDVRITTVSKENFEKKSDDDHGGNLT